MVSQKGSAQKSNSESKIFSIFSAGFLWPTLTCTVTNRPAEA
jgi:hypothetical protein